MANATWKKIAAGKIDPVYLLTGLEQHIFDATIERLKKSLPVLMIHPSSVLTLKRRQSKLF